MQIALAHLDHGAAIERLGRVVAAREAWERSRAVIAPAAARSESPELERTLALAYLRLDRRDEAAGIIARLRGTAAWNDELDRLARAKGAHPGDM